MVKPERSFVSIRLITAAAFSVCLLAGPAVAQLPVVRSGDPVPRDVRELYDAGCRYLAKSQDRQLEGFAGGTRRDRDGDDGALGLG